MTAFVLAVRVDEDVQALGRALVAAACPMQVWAADDLMIVLEARRVVYGESLVCTYSVSRETVRYAHDLDDVAKRIARATPPNAREGVEWSLAPRRGVRP